MAIYALTIAVPFVVLAVMPGLLGRLPRAGSWMNEFKHLGGLIEIAAAFKFLVIVDIAWNLGFFTRGVVLSLWSVIALVAGGYTLGLIRMHGDDRLEGVGAGRLLLAVLWFALGLWFAAGLLGGADLGVIESFFPVAAGASSSPW
jgi:thiol:disulfide interchange protein DsbD